MNKKEVNEYQIPGDYNGKKLDIYFKGCYNKKLKEVDKINLSFSEYLPITTEESLVIDLTDLRSIVFMMSDENNRFKLMDVKDNRAVNLDYKIQIQATKDIKEGEIIKADLKIQIADLHLETVLNALVSLNGKEKVQEIINNIK